MHNVGALLQDFKFSIRMLAKKPGFTFIAVLTLALGIGANAAIFSLMDQVLLRDLPVKNPKELVILRSPGPHPGHTWSDGDDAAYFSYPAYREIQDQAHVFSAVLARHIIPVSIAGSGVTERARGELVSGNYFELLGVQPALGRLLGANDETAPGANPIAILSYAYWVRQFGRNPAVLNKSLTVNGTPLVVVGVSQAGFTGIEAGQLPDVFIPLTMEPQILSNFEDLSSRKDIWLALIGRLAPGLTIPRAEVEIQPSFHSILASDTQTMKLSGKSASEYANKRLFLVPGEHGWLSMQNSLRTPLVSLMAMVSVILMIACANLAGLLVAQGEARRKEIAVRLALGAGRWRLARQFLTESLLLGAAGGLAGLAVGEWTLKILVGSVPAGESLAHLKTSLDGRVWLFASVVTLLTSILFGLAPSIRASRGGLEGILRDQNSTTSPGRTGVQFRKWLVAFQVGLTVVLLAGAGLFIESLMHLNSSALGIRPDHVVQFAVGPGDSGYTSAQTLSFVNRLRDSISALPGVRSVSAAEIPVFEDDDSSGNVTIEGYQPPPDVEVELYRNQVGPDYFSTMGIPLLAGREFQASDTSDRPHVAIINQEAARLYFAGRNPIGLHIVGGGGKDVRPNMEIVGVVANSKDADVRTGVRPFLYIPYMQDPRLESATFYVRTQQDPSSLVTTLKEMVQQIDTNIPIYDARTLQEQIDNSVYSDRLLTYFSISLAVLAALLAAIGLYGVLAFLVVGRTREIGIRIALGAPRASISWLVLREVVEMCLAGAVFGLLAAYIGAHLIQSLLYGVGVTSAPAYLAAAGVLGIIGLLASWLPAHRAAKVDPIVALRYE
ncbi:MAG TPA: ABC transporter permease [Candidatus Acidoferrum sp.]|nr:ABC transporter permease [Candidatus Acidoferrum sp.]